MLSPAIIPPSSSRLGRAVISVVGRSSSQSTSSPLGSPCRHARALSTTGKTCLLHGGQPRLRPSVAYSGSTAGTGAGASAASPSARRCAFHRTASVAMPRRRSFFTSNLLLRPDGSDGESGSKLLADSNNNNAPPVKDVKASTSSPSAAAMLAAKRKPRSAGAKHSLRRVAVIAQQQPGDEVRASDRSPTSASKAKEAAAAAGASQSPSTRLSKVRREALELSEAETGAEAYQDPNDGSNIISAVCLAESFDMERVMAVLQAQGFHLDPDGSGFESHEVVHARKWWPEQQTGDAQEQRGEDPVRREVDLFVFESGTLVGWGLPADDVDALATAHLVAAADDPFVALRETETLDFRRDAARETSAMRGDVVVLGTRHEAAEGDRLATTRAQIAFSSGLARSTKLAVLERSFTDYFESTRRIPEMLAGRGKGLQGGGGGLGHISQKFILQKTGELLSLRAQLNHYRELTDALPDIFWDARAELGLEGYYEQVGRALDVGVRIKTLNQKMDYAQEIATVLREISSERHGTRLEWIIIVLIAVEVVFELRRVYLERQEGKNEKKEEGETV